MTPTTIRSTLTDSASPPSNHLRAAGSDRRPTGPSRPSLACHSAGPSVQPAPRVRDPEPVRDGGSERARHDVRKPQREDRAHAQPPAGRAGGVNTIANSTAEKRYPRCQVTAVRSPAAVPSAKVVITAAHYNPSRRRVEMLWIGSVFSLRHQTAKTAASASVKSVLEATYGTLRPTWSTSAAMMPKTPTAATASQ